MNHLQKLGRQILLLVFGLVLCANACLIVLWLILDKYLDLPIIYSGLILTLLATSLAILFAYIIKRFITEPVEYLWQAILHVSPNGNNMPAPTPEKAKIGRELVSTLILQVYQLAGATDESMDYSARHASIGQAATIAHNLPLPVFVMDKDLTVRYVNEAALKYCESESSAVLGRNLYDVVDLSFSSENTFESWLKQCRNTKVTASQSWDRVRLKVGAEPGFKQFDLAASYSKDDPAGIESMITLFDHSERYNQDDQALNFIALAVHELRTPLTALRGYIEVFQDEVSDKLEPELKDFMYKMQASSEALSSFVNNILNVARVEENQLVLKLESEPWPQVLKDAIDMMSLQAEVHNKTIELSVAGDLPPVAVDHVSITEVISNLIDNAVKYSGDGPKRIIVSSSVNQEGLIETSVQDFGVGIPTAIVGNLFEKFYRNHRTRAQIGGTGLGLYLSKSIVSAHGGNIWVRSVEGEGSTFSFTLLPYSKLADEQKSGDNKEITRGAYGWIKNHSLYRR